MKTILEIYTKIFTNRRGGYTGPRRGDTPARAADPPGPRTVTHGNFLQVYLL